MAAEYFASSQAVALNNPIDFEASIPCTKGYVFHENGTGVFTLRGVTTNCFARYQVVFNGNISIPEAGAVTAIALGIKVSGETKNSSTAVFTPQSENEEGNVTCTAIITVPRGCCKNISIDYVDATVNDAAVTPTPTITVNNGNLVISRIA